MTIELSEEAALAVIEVLDLGKFSAGTLPDAARQLLDAIAVTYPQLVTRYGTLWEKFHRGVARSLGAGDDAGINFFKGNSNRTIAHLLLTGRAQVNSVSEEVNRTAGIRTVRVELTIHELRHVRTTPTWRGHDL